MILPTLPVKRNYLNVLGQSTLPATCMLPVPSHASIHPSLISPFLFRPNDLTFPPLRFHGASPSLFVAGSALKASKGTPIIFCAWLSILHEQIPCFDIANGWLELTTPRKPNHSEENNQVRMALSLFHSNAKYRVSCHPDLPASLPAVAPRWKTKNLKSKKKQMNK